MSELIERAFTDANFLRRAIVVGDPKSELLVRIDDIMRALAECLARRKIPDFAWFDLTHHEKSRLIENEMFPPHDPQG